MQNSILKLTALAGVVGIGFLGVLQAQRGLTNALPNPLHANAGAHAGDHQHEASAADLGASQDAEAMFAANAPADPVAANIGSGSQHSAGESQSSTRAKPGQDPFGAAAEPFASADAGFPPQQAEPAASSGPANPFLNFSAQVDAIRSAESPTSAAEQSESVDAVTASADPFQSHDVQDSADQTAPAEHAEIGNPFADTNAAGTAAVAAEASTDAGARNIAAPRSARSETSPLSTNDEADPWLAAPSTEDTAERVQLVAGTQTPQDVNNADHFTSAPDRFPDETAKPLDSMPQDLGIADFNAAGDVAEVSNAGGPQFPGMTGRNAQASALVPAEDNTAKDDSYYFGQDRPAGESERPLFEADAAEQTGESMTRQSAEAPASEGPERDAGTGVLFTSEDQASGDDMPAFGGSPTPSPADDAFQFEPDRGEQATGDLFGGSGSFAEEPAASEPSSPFETNSATEDEDEDEDGAAGTFTTSSASSFGAAADEVETAPALSEESARPRPVDLPASVLPDVAEESAAFTFEAGSADAADEADPEPFGSPSPEQNQNNAPRLRTPAEPRQAPPHTEEEPGASRESPAAPGRLDLPQDAVRMLNSTEQALQGTGTVTSEAAAGQQSPELTIEKIAPPAATLGAPMVYSILIRNIGNSEARQVVVEDEIPKGTKLTGTIPRAKLVDKTLVWQLGTLAPGAQKKISVRVVPFEEGQIGSVARVNFVAAVAAKTTITKPILKLDVNAPSEARVGEQIVFQFKLVNRGNADAQNVFLRDIIPDGLKHPGGNDLEYEVGTLAAGKSRDIKLTLTATESGEFVNHAVITADGGVATEIKAAVNVIGNKFRISRSGPKARYVGRQAVYENTIQNESRHALESITVIEAVPEGVKFVQASAGGQYNAAKREIAWRVDSLEPLGTKTFEVTLMPTDAGVKHSSVRAYDSYGTHAEVSSQTKVVGFANLTVDIPEFSGAVARGEQSNIRISVRNRGASRAGGVSLTLVLPSEVQFVSATGPAGHRVEGNQVVFGPIESLEGRGEAAFDVSLTAVRAGDVRLHVQVEAEGMSRPVTRDEALIIFDEQR